MFFRHQSSNVRAKISPTTLRKVLSFSLAAVLLLVCSGSFFSPIALAYEETAETEAVKEAVETFLRSYAEEAMLYNSSDQTVCTVSTPNVKQIPGYGELTFRIGKKDVSLAELQKNIDFVEKKALFYASMRQMQNIYRENLQLSYRYPVLSLEETVCHASVTEAALFNYTDSEQPSIYETTYSIDLIKLEGQWLIADITDWSRFDTLYKKDPAFDVTAALAELEINLHTEACSISSPYDGAASDETARLTYNGANAAAYAYTYSRQDADTPRDGFYNPLFKSYAGHGGDCMNFVSQCMWAGFGGSRIQTSVAENVRPMDMEGDSKWYSHGAGSDKEPALAWVSCQSFRKYLTGELDGTGTEGSNAGNDPGMYAAILDLSAGSPVIGVPAESLVGAAAHVEGSGGPYAHAIILTAAIGTSRGEIWFCSHTKDMTHIKLGDCYFGPMKIYIPRYMRIGLPQPVSTQPDTSLRPSDEEPPDWLFS